LSPRHAILCGSNGCEASCDKAEPRCVSYGQWRVNGFRGCLEFVEHCGRKDVTLLPDARRIAVSHFFGILAWH